MSGFRGAVAFLTRVPIPTSIESELQLARSVPWFPLVGALLGLLIASVYAALWMFSPFVAATIAIAMGVVTTGALHEDGLGDVADAFWGGWDRKDRLAILKDPRLGTFGALAIAVSLILRIGVLSGLTTWQALALLPAAHALSRAAAISAMCRYEPIAEGLSASFLRSLRPSHALMGVAAGMALGVAAIGLWVLPAAVLSWAGAWSVGSISMRKIGGISGDVLGATQQTAECLVVLMGAWASGLGWQLAWWLQ